MMGQLTFDKRTSVARNLKVTLLLSYFHPHAWKSRGKRLYETFFCFQLIFKDLCSNAFERCLTLFEKSTQMEGIEIWGSNYLRILMKIYLRRAAHFLQNPSFIGRKRLVGRISNWLYKALNKKLMNTSLSHFGNSTCNCGKLAENSHMSPAGLRLILKDLCENSNGL